MSNVIVNYNYQFSILDAYSYRMDSVVRFHEALWKHNVPMKICIIFLIIGWHLV